MVVLEKKPTIEQNSLTPHNHIDNNNNINHNNNNSSFDIPIIKLGEEGCGAKIVRACEELGFFKVTNHGVPMELIDELEGEAMKFFSKSEVEKERLGIANPFGYGCKRIGFNGDDGWIEYLLLEINSNPLSNVSLTTTFMCLLNEYVMAAKKVACEVLELMSEGLKIEPRNILSRIVMDERSDSYFRLNHYPSLPNYSHFNNINNNDINNNNISINSNGVGLTGFGEHTDPQIISLLRSNNTNGLEICLKNGSWVSVPPDEQSFFVNVGDSLQVLTNGRFRSVKHRVITNRMKARLSMIYFGGPACNEKISPLPSLIGEGEQKLYKEFTWQEYKKYIYTTTLIQNRLVAYEM